MIIVTAGEDQLRKNRNKLFRDDQELLERYAIERLLLLQKEILRQSREIDPDKIVIVGNNLDVGSAASQVLSSLFFSGTIEAI